MLYAVNAVTKKCKTISRSCSPSFGQRRVYIVVDKGPKVFSNGKPHRVKSQNRLIEVTSSVAVDPSGFIGIPMTHLGTELGLRCYALKRTYFFRFGEYGLD